jgi:acyl carrier protein
MAIEKVDPTRRNMTGNHSNTKIREFILGKFPLARKRQLKDSDALLESGILDSLGVLDLVRFIEQEFSISVADEDLVPDNFQTIDRIAAFIGSRAPFNG